MKVMWTRDPPSGPFPGIYAAIDIASHYANVDRHCGYVVLYQKTVSDGFEIMRQESNFIDTPPHKESSRKNPVPSLTGYGRGSL
jgi:hypothetical protein